MALTDFSDLPAEEIKLWSKDVWKIARKRSFWEQFTGTDSNSPIQRITELKKDVRGHKAVITLTPDVLGRGIVGDETLSGNEAAMVAYDQVIAVDQQRQGVKSKGRMSEQKAVVEFRKAARDSLGVWLSNMRDTLITLKLSGITFDKNLNGSANTPSGSHDTLTNLAFATQQAPTSKRIVHALANGAWGDGAGTTPADANLKSLSYAHIVNLKAIAKERGIKPVRGSGGDEVYHLIVNPVGMAALKLDSDFISNVRHAGVRGDKNELFKGTTSSVMVDGIMIHESHFVYNTRGLSSGSRFGSSGTVHGQRCLLLGAQAGAVADIGDMSWDEADTDDYGNQPGIAVSKIWGVVKTQFKGSWDDPTVLHDFSMLTVDTLLA